MKIVIGGDISVMTRSEAFENGQETDLFDEGLRGLFHGSDEAVINLECALTDKDCKIQKCGPNLKAPTRLAGLMKKAGITVCALSNNHIFDFGKAGVRDTLSALDGAGLAYTGYGKNALDARRDLVLEKDGKKVAIIDVCEHEYSYALPDREGAREYDPYDTNDDIAAAKKNADCVIVVYHGGKEYCKYPSPRLVKLCRSMIKHGADVVLCQHTHCIGCYEEFQGGHIVYGQGNFHFQYEIADPIEAKSWSEGLAAVVEVTDGGVKFSVEPTVLKGAKLCLAQGEERETILGELKERSKCMADGSWLDGWRAFCNTVPWYTDALRSGNLDVIAHYIDCEAHLDVIRERHKTWNHTNEKE